MTGATAAFDGAPRTAQAHFQLLFNATVYRLLDHLRALGRGEAALDRALRRHPFLLGYLESMAPAIPDEVAWSEAVSWWDEAIDQWERLDPALHLPLRALVTAGVIDRDQRAALMLAGLVEEDARFGAVMAELQPTNPQRRPCLGLIAAIVKTGCDRPVDAWGLAHELVEAGLVVTSDTEAPRSEWVLRVAPHLWGALRGEPTPPLPFWCDHSPGDLPAFEDLMLPVGFRDQLRQVGAIVGARPGTLIVLRGMGGSDRRRIAAALARDLGLGMVLVAGTELTEGERARQLGPVCTALGALPVICYDPGPGETVEVPRLRGYPGPIIVILGLEGGLGGDHGEGRLTLTTPDAPVEQRLRHWTAALDGHAGPDLPMIAERFFLPPRHIRAAAATAVAGAALDQREIVTVEDVRAAAATLNRQRLDSLASRIEPDRTWHDLVVSPLTQDRLDELEHRCRHRERILDHLGPAFGTSAGRGVRALFTGGSGTGKTLAATILAAALGMDVYRVDLAAVVNKYVGETEKNLHRVLKTAEELDVVLLIDEGDSLLGNRTEVRSANDRFANLETNYLLQRLESYQGIVLVTSNAAEKIDGAFQRRMDVVVPFVQPGPSERYHIWQIHLPADHEVEQHFLEDVAGRCSLTGGQIRNASMRAALLALENGTAVGNRHVRLAVAAEYGKAGAVSPFDGNRRAAQRSGAQSFLDALA